VLVEENSPPAARTPVTRAMTTAAANAPTPSRSPSSPQSAPVTAGTTSPTSAKTPATISAHAGSRRANSGTSSVVVDGGAMTATPPSGVTHGAVYGCGGYGCEP